MNDNNISQQRDIPGKWSIVDLWECVEILDGKRVPVNLVERNKRLGDIPYYGATGQVGWIDDSIFDEELLLLGEDGAPFLDPTKPKAYVISGKSWVNNHAHVLKAVVGLTSNRFLCYYLNQVSYNLYVSGTTRLKLNQAQMRGIPITLPPLPEQHRLVSKIEELFTKLDAGVEELHKVKAQLKRYRQSVLKAAFEGKLTEEWREAHQSELEPASVLLDKIRIERKKSGKYKESPPIDIKELPELPKEWVWTTLNELSGNENNAIKAGPFGSSLKKESYVATGYKVYGQEQVISGNPSFGNYYITKEKYDNLISCSVKAGDLLISLVGTIGKVLILPDDVQPGIINPRLAKLSLDKNLIVNKYIKAYLESSAVRHFFSLTSHGGTMDILNLTILKALPIPLPSVAEQDNIIDEVDRTLSVADEIEKTIGQCLKEVYRLRQSILKQAFEGKLVPQDSSDEPAEKLLERIKAARNKEGTKGRLTHAK